MVTEALLACFEYSVESVEKNYSSTGTRAVARNSYLRMGQLIPSCVFARYFGFQALLGFDSGPL